MRRRLFLKSLGGLACSCWGNASPAICRETSDISGCLLQAGDYDALGINTNSFGIVLGAHSLSESTGDQQLDRALGQALSRMATLFDVKPSFAFFDEAGSPNAYASTETVIAGTKGSVAFGTKLFQDQFSRYNDNGVSVLAICAHEFAHISQYDRGISDQLKGDDSTVRRIELHADFLAGWYLGHRKTSDSSISLWASGDTFNRIGDTNFNSPDHHGTPEERVKASQEGFDLGTAGESSIDVVVEKGIEYISALP